MGDQEEHHHQAITVPGEEPRSDAEDCISDLALGVIILAIPFLLGAVIVLPITLPISMLVYLIAHVVRVFVSNDYNYKMEKFLYNVALAHLLTSLFVCIELLICMLIFGVASSLKHHEIHGVSITRWIGVLLIIICASFICSKFIRIMIGYDGLIIPFSHWEKTAWFYEGLIGAINCLLYLLALFLVTRVAPILKNHTIQGLPTHKWIKMIILLALGHHVISMATSLIVIRLRGTQMLQGTRPGTSEDQNNIKPWLTRALQFFMNTKTTYQWTRYIVYYAEGLRKSVNFVLTSLLLLLTWILYFGSRLNRSEFYDISTWTLVCILGTALLWSIKSGIVLTWEARVVYNRFDQRISGAAKQLYLIAAIAGAKFNIFGFWRNDTDNNISTDDRAEWRAYKRLTQAGSKDDTYDIKRMTTYFMAAELPLSNDGNVSEFLAGWCRFNPDWCKEQPADFDIARIEAGPILNLHGAEFDRVDFNLFQKQLKEEENEFGITDSKKWIVHYHKVCLELGRTIAGAMEVVEYLNKIMTVVLVGAVIIVWLLLTGIATTKVIVLIASPILAVSFIFGESARTLFQGIMFTYVMHSFDVGDLCTINGVQMEVKRIGLWKTIFSQVGNEDEVVYPNTALSTISIVNHKRDLNLNHDYVELGLSYATTKEQIVHLKGRIQEYLDSNENGLKKHPDHGVLVKDIGQSAVTIGVHFQHNETTIEDMMSTDGHKKKVERRHEFLLHMKALLDELDIKESTEEH